MTTKTYTIEDIQNALNHYGFSVGGIDGILGRRTLAAIKAFQIDRHLDVDGIVGPKTLAALFNITNAEAVVADNPTFAMPWLDMAITKKGLNENKNHAELMKFLRADGGTVGDPAKVPWCGDFVETCIALTLTRENLPGNPYLARNWAKFGQHVEPTLGAVGVFWRGQPHGIEGHVAFLVGKVDGFLYILGGNQSNAITVTRIAENRLIDSRWPLSVPLPKKIKLPALVGGKLSLNEA